MNKCSLVTSSLRYKIDSSQPFYWRVCWRIAIVVAASLVVLSCETQGPAPYTSDIYLVRHFQKQADGASVDVDLSVLGENNAIRLAQHLHTKQINAIYSTDYQRTKQTAQPSSDRFDVAITFYEPAELDALASKLLKNNNNQLVIGHSNTTGELFGLLGCESTALSESDYGDVFVVTRLHNNHQATLHACSRYQLDESASSQATQAVSKGENVEYYHDITQLMFIKKVS